MNSSNLAGELARDLREARSRTLGLTRDLTPQQFIGPMLPTINPVGWEIGHVGWFHEYWTLRHLHGEPPLLANADALWNSSKVAHPSRWQLDLPDPASTFEFLAKVLERQLQQLDRGLAASAAYFYALAIRHEDMHVEALAYTRQTLGYCGPNLASAAAVESHGACPGDVEVPGGNWQLGASQDTPFVFDNEKWAHPVELSAFSIARAPVTNAEFLAFVEAGGYRFREFWSDEGWAWRQREEAARPRYWLEDQGISYQHYDAIAPLRPHAPMVFVNWYEAQAWCRWAGRRLPTEAEWEAAAIGEADAHSGRLAARKRSWPWGEEPCAPSKANLDLTFDGPLDVDACAAGDSAFGCRQMIGNVWEWTASDFVPFPGFAPDSYEDYSQPWFGTRKVLRGGSWATSSRIARPGYRNFFTPERNDVFAGFRTCAR